MKREPRILDSKDTESWVLGPKYYTDWVRQVASEYNIDVSKYLLGYVLDSILVDDNNCFG